MQLEEQKALKAADAAATPNNESVALAAAATPTPTTAATPRGESNTVAGKLKTWALSGLTPAEKEEELRRQSMESQVVKDEILNRPGTNDHAKGGNTGVLSSITGWWSGR